MITMQFMLEECQADMAANSLYISDRLTAEGKAAYRDLLERAIKSGNEQTLLLTLQDARFWVTHKQRIRQGKPYWAKLPAKAVEVLAESEFNVFCMRRLSRKSMKEGQERAEVYRVKSVLCKS